jgi:tyrosine aminotransferase
MWNIAPSDHSIKTINIISKAVGNITLPQDFPLPTYSLAYGDPSVYADFEPDPVVVDSVIQTLKKGKGNGYTNELGWFEARKTLSQVYSYQNIDLEVDDVIMDIGGLGAISTILQVFLNPGDNILIPSPGFPLYRTMAENLNAEGIVYKLNPYKSWEVDLEDLDAQVTPNTKLLVIVNPSNPCGSVYSKEHLLEILAWAEKNKVCILADEVYHNMTFQKPYYPLGSLTDQVPVFTVNALSKMFLVPGWRCGWIIIYDKYKKCERFKLAIKQIRGMLYHPTNFIMQAIPNIFENLPGDYFSRLMKKVKERLDIVMSIIPGVPGLHLEIPEGSLYCMVSIDFTNLDLKDSIEFSEKLAIEKGVAVLPAENLLSANGFRIVLCNPSYIIEECMQRIKSFVISHTKAE